MGMIDANGVQLYAEQAGQGDDVIFISGLADEGACWVDQVAGLSDRPERLPHSYTLQARRP